MVKPLFEVIFFDSHLVVVEKESGLLSTPAHGEESLVDLLNQKFFGRHDMLPVHRLDRLTSGLLVFARSPEVAAGLARQFAIHSVDREYVAIVGGHLQKESGSLRAPILGKRAVTHYRIITTNADSTTMAVRLETGRRNQIRIHFAGLGHPILGDSRFGAEQPVYPHWPHARIALHARVLGFLHPVTKMPMRFEAPTPASFQGIK